MQELTVGQVADLVGISVRTLHHWDEIGLVTPSWRSWSGYRLYTREDVERVQRVCLYRETGMALARIAELLDDPGLDELAHLARQRELLLERISHLRQKVSAVDQIMETMKMGTNLDPAQKAEHFGGWDPAWQEEAQAKWGDTPEWRQSEAVKAKMTPEDWFRVGRDTQALEQSLAEAKRDGVEPGSDRANELAEAHRASLGTWFDVTHSKHVLIARGYVMDDRFRQYYDKIEPGLTDWLKSIIDENARANGVDPTTATWQ